MTVIGSRTSEGKTAFVMQIMCDLLKQGKTVMYLGFEMKQDELMERMFSHIMKIDNFELLTGRVEDLDSKLYAFQKIIKNFKFLATDDFGKNWKQIEVFIDDLSKTPDVIVIDYIQAISQGQGQGKAFIDDYILNLRNMCISKGFAGLLVSQLNRASQDRKDTTPKLHDLKGSGFLEEIADLVILLQWVGRESGESTYEVNVAKNRRGRTGFLKLNYEPKYHIFSDIPDGSKANVEWEE